MPIVLGNDTDTTAVIAGGIAWVRYGLSGVPSVWRERLRGKVERSVEEIGRLRREPMAGVISFAEK